MCPSSVGGRSELCKSWVALSIIHTRVFEGTDFASIAILGKIWGVHLHSLCTPGSAAPVSQRGKRIKYFLKSAEPRHFNKNVNSRPRDFPPRASWLALVLSNFQTEQVITKYLLSKLLGIVFLNGSKFI